MKIATTMKIRATKLVLFLLLLIPTIEAHGQQLEFDAMNAQTFRQIPDRGKFLHTYDTDTLRQLGVETGLGISYSPNLLVVRENREIKRSVLKEVLTTELLLAFGIVDMLQMDLSFPFHAYVKAGYVDRADTFTTNYPGDLRLGAKAKFLDRREYPVGLGLRGYLNAPTGKDERYLGDEKVGGGFEIISDVEIDRTNMGASLVYFGLNLGYHIRDKAITPDQEIDDQLTFSAAANLQLTDHFELVFDTYGSTVAKEAFKGTFGNPVEGAAGMKFYMTSGYSFTLGAARGFTSGFGAAPYRFFTNLTWRSPQDRDRDRDGVQDYRDQCAGHPEDLDGYEDWDGCPDFDQDEDRIPDHLDLCPTVNEDFDGFQDEDGCPDYDNDGDGVLDVNDKCPDEYGEGNDGCPEVVEIFFRGKVVDAQSGEGLSGTIDVSPGVGEVTYRDGNFDMKFDDAKVYEFEFRSPGYLPESRKFSLGAGQNFDIRIKLKRDTRGVEELQQQTDDAAEENDDQVQQ